MTTRNQSMRPKPVDVFRLPCKSELRQISYGTQVNTPITNLFANAFSDVKDILFVNKTCTTFMR